MKKNAKKIIAPILLLIIICSSGLLISCTKNAAPDTSKRVIKYLNTIVGQDSNIKFSSNPYDYINANKETYNKLVELGNSALDFMLDEFKNSSDNGLKEYIMAVACDEIMGKKAANISSGREWYNKYGTK